MGTDEWTKRYLPAEPQKADRKSERALSQDAVRLLLDLTAGCRDIKAPHRI